MSDNDLINYIKKVETNFNSHVEKGTIEMSLEYYNLCEELIARGINAIQENQKLKKEIEKIIAVADTNSELADKFYNKIQKSKEMQREFIEWLENEKKEQFIQHRICHQSYQLFIEKIIETETMILEKYKEIIGDKDE